MKIAVVGCGAVGSYYGASLAKSGHEVHFLLRSDYDVVRRHGVRIRSPQGDFTVRPKAAISPEAIGLSDLVIIGLKTTANGQFERLLKPLVGPDTAILTLQNGLGNEEQLAGLFGPSAIMGGLCFVCLNRIAPGVIRHMAHGMVVLGEFGRWPEPRTHDVAGMFRHAGVPCKVTDDLARSHWEKLTWNVPFNGLGVAGIAGYEGVLHGRVDWGHARGSQECLSTAVLLSDAPWTKLARELMLEVINAGRGLGHELSEALVRTQMERTLSMGPYKASTLLDFERGQPLELESLFLEPLKQAASAGVAVPRLENMCRVLQELDRARSEGTLVFNPPPTLR